MKTTKKSSTLKSLLNSAVDSVKGATIDLLGYERKVTESVTKFLHQQSAMAMIPVDRLAVNIYYRHLGVGVNVHKAIGAQLRSPEAVLREISPFELVEFFQEGSSTMPGVVDQVCARVLGYMQTYQLTVDGVLLQDLNFDIRIRNERVIVEAYKRRMALAEVPLKDLIKHFAG